MMEQTKRISFRISYVFKVEPEPDLHTGFGQKEPAPQHWTYLVIQRVTDKLVSDTGASLFSYISIFLYPFFLPISRY